MAHVIHIWKFQSSIVWRLCKIAQIDAWIEVEIFFPSKLPHFNRLNKPLRRFATGYILCYSVENPKKIFLISVFHDVESERGT